MGEVFENYEGQIEVRTLPKLEQGHFTGALICCIMILHTTNKMILNKEEKIKKIKEDITIFQEKLRKLDELVEGFNDCLDKIKSKLR